LATRPSSPTVGHHREIIREPAQTPKTFPSEPQSTTVQPLAISHIRPGRGMDWGSSLGSLWLSDDRGDSWKAVSHHLTPSDHPGVKEAPAGQAFSLTFPSRQGESLTYGAVSLDA